MPDFSFEQDVAPYASKFFARSQANPLLSTAKKTQLSGDLLDKLEAFKKVSDEDEDRSLQKEIRRTQLDRERLALDDARLDFQDKREASEQEPEALSEFSKIFDETSDPNEQQRRLGLLGVRYSNVIANSRSLAFKYRAASDAITKPAFTAKDMYMLNRQAEQDKKEDIKFSISEKRRGESAEARADREERAALDRIFDVRLEPDDMDTAAVTEKRKPRAVFTNRADRDKLLTFLAEQGQDVSALKDADDETVNAAAWKFRSTLATRKPEAARAPLVDFNLSQ